jgi:hypothetical protein
MSEQRAITKSFDTQMAESRLFRGSLGDDVRLGTYKAILRQTRIKEEAE